MLKMENCTVLDNEANSSVIYGVESVVSIAECVFENNTGFLAGTIYATNYSALTVNSSTFTQNRGTGNASIIAIYNHGNISIQNTNYTFNKGKSFPPSSQMYYNGTVVCIYHCFLNIDNCIFTGNYAWDGGVVVSDNSNLEIINSIFKNNSAYSAGGVLVTTNSKLNISSSIFYRNVAETSGGALFIADNSSIICVNSQISKNSAPNGGGLVVGMQSNATLAYLIINQNNGSGVYFSDCIFASIHTCSFNTNTRGAVKAGWIIKLVVENSDFFHNEATVGAAIWIGSVNNFIISHVRFVENIATVRGGAIFSVNVDNMSIDGSIFRGNIASYDSRVLESSHDNIYIQNSQFEANRAEKGSGGVLSITLGTLSMSNCSVKHSYAASGGAVQGNECDIDLTHCTFENNIADINGGAVSITGYSLRSHEVTYLNNTASTCGEGKGGAIHTEQCNIYAKLPFLRKLCSKWGFRGNFCFF